jgi:hypothetical protein
MQSNHRDMATPGRIAALAIAVNLFVAVDFSLGEEKTPVNSAATESARGAADRKAPPALPEPKGAQRLSPDYPVWLDPNEKAVLVDGQIALREGMLDLLACTRNTKEHESIVSANTKAFIVHAGLLRLGAEVGHPVQFRPEYKPPTGTEIDVLVRWLDEKGKQHEARAQDWIKDLHTKKTMAQPFVFAGSGFWVNPDTGKQHYQAEGGDFVCVANFGTAMLDIPVMSSQSNEELEFEAFTEKIPPLGTPVRLVFKPKLGKESSQVGGQRSEKKHQTGNSVKGSAKETGGEAK